MRRRCFALPLLLALAAGCSAGQHDGGSPAVAVSVTGCGTTWHPGPAGLQALSLHNVDSSPGEVQVVGRGRDNRDRVYAQAEPVGPGTTVRLHVRLGPGRYALRCLMEDQPAVAGPVVTVAGTGRPGRGVVPVTNADLIRPAKRYTDWVAGRLPRLVRDSQRMLADLHAGDVAAARADWVSAHLDYERLGAAYGAFGDLDDAINGLPYGLPGGVHDPTWTGFHAIEHGLWSAHPDLRRLAAAAARLVSDVRRLQGQLARNPVDPQTLAIRAHEISENVLQFQLTGLDDFGSHTSLRTTAVALQGTAVVLRVVRPVLDRRMPTAPLLVRVRDAAALVDRDAAAAGEASGLARRQRERLDATISDLCERLAPVAATLEPRRTS